MRHKGVEGTALTVTRHDEQLAVAAFMNIDVQNALDLNHVLGRTLDDRRRAGCSDRCLLGGGGGVTGAGLRVKTPPKSRRMSGGVVLTMRKTDNW